MERNTDEGADGIRFRDQPKTDAEYKGENVYLRAEFEERFKEDTFPAEYGQYLGS